MDDKFNKPPDAIDNIEQNKAGLFGQRLYDARLKLGKTRTQIANELGLKNDSSVKGWEVRQAFPTEDKVPAMAEAYKIDLQELVDVLAISKAAYQESRSGRLIVYRNTRKK